MGLFDSIKSVFGGAGNGGRDADRIYIVDAEKLADSRDGRTGPVERFRAIQQLARFADREKVQIIAVLGGRPLREVANGESLNNVRVYYVEENSSVADQMEKTIGSVSSSKAVAITNDKQLDERLVARGIATLRISTLRKALEGGNGDSDGNGNRGRGRGDRNERGERRERRRGPRPDRPRSQEPQQGESSEESAAPASESAPRSDETVDGLIDRIN